MNFLKTEAGFYFVPKAVEHLSTTFSAYNPQDLTAEAKAQKALQLLEAACTTFPRAYHVPARRSQIFWLESAFKAASTGASQFLRKKMFEWPTGSLLAPVVSVAKYAQRFELPPPEYDDNEPTKTSAKNTQRWQYDLHVDHLPQAPNQKMISGVYLRAETANHQVKTQTFFQAGLGEHVSRPTLVFSTALVPDNAPPELCRSSGLFAQATGRTMLDSLDGALFGLDYPRDNNEVHAALLAGASGSWFSSYSEAIKIIHSFPENYDEAASSLTAAIWAHDHLWLINNGLNNVYLLDENCIELVCPAHSRQHQAKLSRLANAQLPAPVQNMLHQAGASSAVLAADSKNQIGADARSIRSNRTAGKVLLITSYGTFTQVKNVWKQRDRSLRDDTDNAVEQCKYLVEQLLQSWQSGGAAPVMHAAAFVCPSKGPVK